MNKAFFLAIICSGSLSYARRNIATCDKENLGECDSKSMCGNMICVIGKLEGCVRENRDDKETEEEWVALSDVHRKICQGITDCDVTSARKCRLANTEGASRETICASMACVLPLTSGCDQKALDLVSSQPGTTYEELENNRDMMCNQAESCNIYEATQCRKPGQQKSVLCENMQCMLENLEGCDTTELNKMIKKHGGQSVEEIDDLMQAMDCDSELQ